MNIARQLSHSLAPLALAIVAATSSAFAAPQIAGMGAGQWTRVSERMTSVEAVLGHRGDQRAFKLDALLIGREKGQVYGTIEQLPPDIAGPDPDGFLHLVYDVLGDYIDLGDGRLYVRAQILLNTAQFGGNELLPVGVLDGELLGFNQVGYCAGGIHVDPLTDPDLNPMGGGKRNAPKAMQAIEPVLRAPLAEPMPSGKFLAHWEMI